MDREIFIHGSSIAGTITERKILKLINGLNSPEHFSVISDRNGLGYADERSGRGVTRGQAVAILERRPTNGFKRLFDIKGPGLGSDTWSDIVISAMRKGKTYSNLNFT